MWYVEGVTLTLVLSHQGLTRVGKHASSYEFQSIDPLSLWERARVRENTYPYQPLTGEG